MPEDLVRKNMVTSRTCHHDYYEDIRDFKAKITDDVAPCVARKKRGETVAKGVTSKSHELLSKISLRRLDKMTDLLKSHRIQKTLVDIDQYSGTTLADLVKFMNDHQLQFAVPEEADEFKLYNTLFLLMDDEYKSLATAGK